MYLSSQTFTRSLSTLRLCISHPLKKQFNATRCDAARRYMLLVAKSPTHSPTWERSHPAPRSRDRPGGDVKSTDNATALPRRRLPTSHLDLPTTCACHTYLLNICFCPLPQKSFLPSFCPIVPNSCFLLRDFPRLISPAPLRRHALDRNAPLLGDVLGNAPSGLRHLLGVGLVEDWTMPICGYCWGDSPSFPSSRCDLSP